jgi:hypothetical protein
MIEDTITEISLAVLFVAAVFLLALMFQQMANCAGGKKQRVDCRIAEISPDIPTNARNECRQLSARKAKL